MIILIITMLFVLAIVWCFHTTSATYVISVYGDVYEDTEFFTKTYPWLIDNIGGEISVDYYLQGSGRYSVPQMCALNEMRLNTFVQAQYLKCEAEGNSSECCLCETGIDPNRYRQCVLTKGSLASLSSSKYSQLGIDARPVIEIGYKNTIFGVDDTWYLKKICTIFGDNPPRGCVRPFDCNGTETYSEKSGVVQFDCQKYFVDLMVSVTYEDVTPSTLSPTTVTKTTNTPSIIIHPFTTPAISTSSSSTTLFPARKGPLRPQKPYIESRENYQ
ncbi:uncharacterized protein [Epargyreus clarus]|uniref:uncharacterized protein n=1 Tax=Epargyreus clarus TaxID=520877 RepID=UPI003C2D2D99